MAISSEKEYLACIAGEISIGIDIDFIQEVFETRMITRLPGGPAFMTGIVNIRGTVVPVLDILQICEKSNGLRKIVVLKTGEGPVGLLISRLVELVKFEKVDEAVQPHEKAIQKEFFAGTGWIESDHFHVLAVEKTIQSTLYKKADQVAL